ncbi:MAG TPA: 2Fe-2S iron-sulfur cluster-binding protein [Rhodocyclaceae bacterium]|nr:2Fe-2S iron-sulfur cluster-binding protein [Rhodocyclaceae bacterium]
MLTLHFQLKDGRRMSVDDEVGNNAMQVATFHRVPGIEGACGGYCSCGTCHVQVLSAHRLPPIGADEEAQLKSVGAKRRKNSRLACQLRLTPELDGLLLQAELA